MRSPGPHSKQGRAQAGPGVSDPSTHCAFQPPPRAPHFIEEDPEPLKGQAARRVGGGPGTAGSAQGQGAGFAELGSGPRAGRGSAAPKLAPRVLVDPGRCQERGPSRAKVGEEGGLLRPMVPLRVRGPRSRTQSPADSAHASPQRLCALTPALGTMATGTLRRPRGARRRRVS